VFQKLTPLKNESEKCYTTIFTKSNPSGLQKLKYSAASF